MGDGAGSSSVVVPHCHCLVIICHCRLLVITCHGSLIAPCPGHSIVGCYCCHAPSLPCCPALLLHLTVGSLLCHVLIALSLSLSPCPCHVVLVLVTLSLSLSHCHCSHHVIVVLVTLSLSLWHCHCPCCIIIVLIVWLHHVNGSPQLNIACVAKITATMNDDQCHHSSFGCHVTDRNLAPGFHINELPSEEGWVYSPGLVAAHVCSWDLAIVREPGSRWFWWAFVVICGWLSLFVGGHLHFLAGRGDGVFVGCGCH